MTEDPRRGVHYVTPITTSKSTASLRAGPVGMRPRRTSTYPTSYKAAPAGGSHERHHSKQDEDAMDVDPPAVGLGMPGTYDNRVREKHTSHHSSRHSRAYDNATAPTKDKERDRDAGSPTSTGSKRGWRGW